MSENIAEIIKNLAEGAKRTSYNIMSLSTDKKNAVLGDLADLLIEQADKIKMSNNNDIQAAKEKGLKASLIDRLLLDDKRITGMASALREIITLDDPVGKMEGMITRPNGLKIGRVKVPIGVIGIIYESRPNVTVDAFALTFKAGNTVILRGGSESKDSNEILVSLIRQALKKNGVDEKAVSYIPVTDREAVNELLKLNEYIDLIIPRGGEGLIRAVTDNSRIPVIKHYKGVCHTYIDENADEKMAVAISVNAKVSRPGVCNAMESLLIHRKFPGVKKIITALLDNGVEIRGDEGVQRIDPAVKPAKEEDWSEEYLDLILSVKEVNSLEEAISHINKYGSHHSESIITRDYDHAQTFLERVDSSSVYVNASTRFTDGGEFGLGAEIGISTDKLHARGPMGLEELTTRKFIIYGRGQIRE